MTYDTVSNFAQTFGLLYLVGLFAIVLCYALWPKNQKKFDHAAHIPLNEE